MLLFQNILLISVNILSNTLIFQDNSNPHFSLGYNTKLTVNTAAQPTGSSVISASGGYYENTNGSVTFTLGEPIVATFTKNGYILTSGFQQTRLSVTTQIGIHLSGYEISVFPNPVLNSLILKTNRFEGLNCELFTINGRKINHFYLSKNQTIIDFSILIPSTYFLKVMDGKKELKTFKIVKQ